MKKEYELKIEYTFEFEGDGSTTAFYTKGHFEKINFRKEIRNYLEYDYEMDRESIEKIMTNEITLQYGKFVPYCGESQIFMDIVNEYKKGYFPITIIEV
jgi:hypothetical protein